MDDEQITEPATEPIIDSTLLPSEIVPKSESSVNPIPSETLDIQPSTIDPVAPAEPTPEPIPYPIVTEQPIPIVAPIPPEPRSEATKPFSSSEELTPETEIIPTTLPSPELSPALSGSESLTVEPVATEQSEGQSSTTGPSSITATFNISLLNDEQLKAAATLYTKRNQAELSRKGVAKRQETMELNLREIVDFLSLNNGSPLPRIAKHTNITLGTTSKYLRQLQSKGKVRADGWGKTRRYFLK
jgi:predicted transcriptional regulator